MGKSYMDKVDNRLTLQDKVLSSMEASVKEIATNSRGVHDTFQVCIT